MKMLPKDPWYWERGLSSGGPKHSDHRAVRAKVSAHAAPRPYVSQTITIPMALQKLPQHCPVHFGDVSVMHSRLTGNPQASCNTP